MTTGAMIGHNSSFSLGRGNVDNDFDLIAEVYNIGPPKLSRAAVEATHMKSPDRWAEFIGGMRDGGEMSIEMNFIPGSTSEAHILDALADDDPRPIKITFPNGEVWNANALVTAYEAADPMTERMTSTTNFKISGKPGFAS